MVVVVVDIAVVGRGPIGSFVRVQGSQLSGSQMSLVSFSAE